MTDNFKPKGKLYCQLWTATDKTPTIAKVFVEKLYHYVLC